MGFNFEAGGRYHAAQAKGSRSDDLLANLGRTG
jgi:hypothetical protein